MRGASEVTDTILIFLPSTNEHQRFVLSGAFDDLKGYNLQYVIPPGSFGRMRSASPGLFSPENVHFLDIPIDRVIQWQRIFNLSCIVHADKSRSFALRVKGTADRAQLDQAVASMRSFPALDDLLTRINPLFCLLPTSLLDDYCNDVLLSGQRQTVVMLQSGWDNLSSKGLIHHKPQFCGVWGEQSARHARDIQGIENPVIFGAPHYVGMKPTPRPNNKTLLFGGSYRTFDETTILKRLDKWLTGSGWKAIYRPHPWRADRRHEQSFFDHFDWQNISFDADMEARYLRSKRQVGSLIRAPLFSQDYLTKLLASVDCVISPMSTLLLEALLMGRPAMALAISDGKHDYNPATSAQMTHFTELKGSVDWCDDETQFEAHCDRLIAQTEAKPAPAEIINTDQPYAKRLAEYLYSIEGIAKLRMLDRTIRIDEPMACGHLPDFGYQHTTMTA